jgi:hypothetical protein
MKKKQLFQILYTYIAFSFLPYAISTCAYEDFNKETISKAEVASTCIYDKEIPNQQAIELECANTEAILNQQSTSLHCTKKVFGHAEKLVMIFMAADNDLRSFAIRNIRQSMLVGSQEPYLHLVIHLDIRDAQGVKITRRYYVLENDYIILNEYDSHAQHMDSGDPNTLISFVKFATDKFPADDHILIFWDHGTGYLDPAQHSRTTPAELFSFNPTTHKFDLDRSNPDNYSWDEEQRGVCWDQSTKNYLTAQKLDYALKTCVQHMKKPFDIIAFDACLMSMIEVADLVSPYAKIMISSEEAILGTGFNYSDTFAPLKQKSMTVPILAEHIVNIFNTTYNRITQDYELSALDLTLTQEITQNIDQVAILLQESLSSQKKETVKRALKIARNNAVHFNEPTYLDLYDLYHNILLQLGNFKAQPHAKFQKTALEFALKNGMELIQRYTIAHCAGSKLQQTRGISIYFPERMHSSYPTSYFAHTYNWYNFLRAYLT